MDIPLPHGIKKCTRKRQAAKIISKVSGLRSDSMHVLRESFLDRASFQCRVPVLDEKSCIFSSHAEQVTEEHLQGFLEELWSGTHSEELLAAARAGPQVNWNPYRSIQNDSDARQGVLNSLVCEFCETIPVDSLFLSGSPFPGIVKENLVKESKISNSEFQTADSTFYFPQELNALHIQGQSLPIHRSESLARHDTIFHAVDEIFLQDGILPVDVLALDAPKLFPSPPRTSPSCDVDLRRVLTNSVVPPEIMTEVESLVFQKLWSQVAVPYYASEVTTYSRAFAEEGKPELVVNDVTVSDIQSSELSQCAHCQRRNCERSENILLLDKATKKMSVSRLTTHSATDIPAAIQHLSRPKPVRKKIQLDQCALTNTFARNSLEKGGSDETAARLSVSKKVNK